MMKRVGFIGIGAQKAATSWLHSCLYEHPDLSLPATKEIHYFSNFFWRGDAWYEEQLGPSRANQIIGEISPSYLYSPEAAARIHDYNPNVKLIVCLREPVGRVVSAYRYAIQVGDHSPSVSLREALRATPAYLEHSRYLAQLQRYLALFPRDQILVVLYEHIATDPLAFVQSIYRFLEVEPSFRPSSATARVNPSRGDPRSLWLDRAVKRLAATARGVGLGDLVWKMARSAPARALRDLNSRAVADEPLSLGDRQELENLFATEVKALAELLQVDLGSLWFDYERYDSSPGPAT